MCCRSLSLLWAVPVLRLRRPLYDSDSLIILTGWEVPECQISLVPSFLQGILLFMYNFPYIKEVEVVLYCYKEVNEEV